jgi:endogenous inhibitor of DNA gyrase (YacG/DUF329 family)
LGTVVIKCPNTKKVVPVGFASVHDPFRTGEYAMATVLCLACGEIHHWQKKDAWVEPVEHYPPNDAPLRPRRRRR